MESESEAVDSLASSGEAHGISREPRFKTGIPRNIVGHARCTSVRVTVVLSSVRS